MCGTFGQWLVYGRVSTGFRAQESQAASVRVAKFTQRPAVPPQDLQEAPVPGGVTCLRAGPPTRVQLGSMATAGGHPAMQGAAGTFMSWGPGGHRPPACWLCPPPGRGPAVQSVPRPQGCPLGCPGRHSLPRASKSHCALRLVPTPWWQVRWWAAAYRSQLCPGACRLVLHTPGPPLQNNADLLGTPSHPPTRLQKGRAVGSAWGPPGAPRSEQVCEVCAGPGWPTCSLTRSSTRRSFRNP